MARKHRSSEKNCCKLPVRISTQPIRLFIGGRTVANGGGGAVNGGSATNRGAAVSGGVAASGGTAVNGGTVASRGTSMVEQSVVEHSVEQ